MNAEVSRALASFIAANGLGRESARDLAKQFADVNAVKDLPDWVKELADPPDERAMSDLERRARRIAR